MPRHRLGLLLGILALAACGGGGGESQSGYFNMRTLAQVLEERARQAGAVGTTVACTRTGKQTAECHVSKTGGAEKQTTSVEVTISADGQTFITR
jgi:hypothetical protein